MKIKTILFLILFIVLNFNAFGQLIVPKVDIPKYVVGIHSAGFIEFGKDSSQNHYHDILIETEPYFSFYPIKNLGFGAMFDYMYVNSTINDYKNFYSIGLMFRYYIPFQINMEMIDKEKLYFECNFNLTNYLFQNRYGYPEVYDKMNKFRVNSVVGLNIHLTKGLYLDFAVQYIACISGIRFWEPRFAVEYHINKKT